MHRKFSTLIAGAALATLSLFSAPDARAELDAVFSTVSDQLVTSVGGGIYLVHQGLYDSTPGLDKSVEPFLPAFVGLDAVDFEEDGRILFSVKSNGVVPHGGGLIQLQQDRVYRFDPATSLITLDLDWVAQGVDIGTLDALDRLPDGSYAFSVETMRWITTAGGNMTLLPENLYRFEPAGPTVSLLFNGKALGLPDLDAAAVLEDGRVAFSTATNVWITTPAGGMYLKQCNAYLVDGANVSMLFDGEARKIKSLDALALGGFSLRVERDRIVWKCPGASTGFDVIRGSLMELRDTGGNFSLATTDCLAAGTSSPPIAFAATPAAGQGYWFLGRRHTTSGAGTWDSGGAGQVLSRESGIAASGIGCP